jgi:hypothetical protein
MTYLPEHIYYTDHCHSRVLHELQSLLISVANHEALTYRIQAGSGVEGLQDPEGWTRRLLHVGKDHLSGLSW